jgi:hypothetical protein
MLFIANYIHPQGAPIVQTFPATNITEISATLNGTVNPNGSNTLWRFYYKKSLSSSWNTTSDEFLMSSYITTPVSKTITTLLPGTAYQFYISANNSYGSSTPGTLQSFTTAGDPPPPIVVTFDATNITTNSATLNGTVNTNGSNTLWRFYYKKSSASSWNTTSDEFLSASYNTTSVSKSITGLEPETTYQFYCFAYNSYNSTPGTILSFTTNSSICYIDILDTDINGFIHFNNVQVCQLMIKPLSIVNTDNSTESFCGTLNSAISGDWILTCTVKCDFCVDINQIKQVGNIYFQPTFTGIQGTSFYITNHTPCYYKSQFYGLTDIIYINTDGNGTDPTLNLNITPSTTVFDPQFICGEQQKTLTITNQSTSSCYIDISVQSSSIDPPFSIVSGGGSFNLTIGQSHIVVVKFNPTQSGLFADNLMIWNNSTNMPSTINYPLSGSGKVELDIKEFLEGPFNGANMNTNLINLPEFPLTQPYNISPWFYNGSESVATIPNNNIVDWVLIELRDAAGEASTANESTIVWRHACFIKDDGSIVDIDGSSKIFTEVNIINNLFIVLYHRNHLSVMSSNNLMIQDCKYSYNFSDAIDKAYLRGHKEIGANIWGMYGGDGNSDGQVNNIDKNDIWLPTYGNNGYLLGDFDMNGNVDIADLTVIWYENTGKASMVPQ